MKKLIVLSILFITGCASFETNPEATRIHSELDVLNQQTKILQNKYEDYQKCHFEFIVKLTDEQLELYNKAISDTETGNPIAVAISGRKLKNSLSEKECQIIADFIREKNEMIAEITYIVNREKELLKELEIINAKRLATQKAIQAFGKSLEEVGEQQRQAYGRQPSILYMPQQNQNYWQEELAYQQYQKNRQQQILFPKPQYGPMLPVNPYQPTPPGMLPRIDFNKYPWND